MGMNPKSIRFIFFKIEQDCGVFLDLGYGGLKTEFCCPNMEIFKLFFFLFFYD